MLVGTLLSVWGCRKTPSDVIAPHKMALLLADIYKSESAIDLNRKDYRHDSSKLALEEAVLRRHEVTREKFDTSLYWYGHHIDEYMKVYDEVIENLQTEIDRTDAIASKIILTAVGDSVDTWSLASRYMFTRFSHVKQLQIELDSDENWENGDNYILNFKVINGISGVKSQLGAEYNDGFIEWIENNTTENGKYSYNLITDSTKTLKRIFGKIVLDPHVNEFIFLDSISLMRTRVNKITYNKRHSQKKIKGLMKETNVNDTIVTIKP